MSTEDKVIEEVVLQISSPIKSKYLLSYLENNVDFVNESDELFEYSFYRVKQNNLLFILDWLLDEKIKFSIVLKSDNEE